MLHVSTIAAAWARYTGRRLALAAMLLCVLAAGCREKPWDPEVAVLVNGRPIEKKVLDRVLELGFNPIVTESEASAPALNLVRILDKLIDERLILEQAAKAGLSVSDHELDEAADFYGTAWFGLTPPPVELGEMKEALRNQLLLRKMTKRVIEENLSLSAEGWRVFWEGWPKERLARYRVRALVIPPLKETPAVPARYRRNLGDMVEYLAREGLDVLVSDPIWTNGLKISPEEAAAIEESLENKRPTRPFRLAESWVVYEALEIDRGLDEAEELLRAKAAFEELEGERVFRDWLAAVRAEADIQINPAYLEISDLPAADDAEAEIEAEEK